MSKIFFEFTGKQQKTRALVVVGVNQNLEKFIVSRVRFFLPTSTSSIFCGKFRLVTTEMTNVWYILLMKQILHDVHKNPVNKGKTYQPQLVLHHQPYYLYASQFAPPGFISPERSRGLPWFLATQMMKTTASKLFARCGACCWPKLEVSLEDHNNLPIVVEFKK